jgi:oxygen-independent coproporphyrinogen-3 oxidase
MRRNRFAPKTNRNAPRLELRVRELEAALAAARDAAEEKVLLGLRTVEGVALTDLAQLGRTGTTDPLAGLIADGFLVVEAGRVRTSAAGRPVLDGVLRALLV